MPISRFLLNLLFLTASILWGGIFSPALATTWYVAPLASGGSDANPGTLAQPFYTFYPAISAAQPGDTISARGGTYNYPTGQYVSCSGTASAWITVSAYPGETPVIIGTSMPMSQFAIGIGGQYLVIQGFTIQQAPNGIGSWEMGHLRILDNTLSGCVSWGITIGAASFGNATDILIDGNRVHDNDQANNPPCSNCGWPAAISPYWADGITISNNVSYHNFGEGIAISHSDHVLVVNNTSYDNYSVEIYMDNDQFCTIGANLAYSTFNPAYYRFGFPAMGIACANENYTTPNPLSNDVIVNNVVINNRFGFDYGNFMNGGGMKNFIVANNTFYGAQDTLLQIDDDPGHVNNLIENNVFIQTGGNNMDYVGAPQSAFTFSHNSWTGGSAGAAVGPGDVLVPPLLLNPGTDVANDYSPKPGSPLIDAGGAVSVVAVDYRGVPRPQGPAYDIGAFEGVAFTPTATPTPLPCGYPGNTCTPTATPNPHNDVAFPNPWDGKEPLSFFHTVNQPADAVRLKLYTLSWRKIFEDGTLAIGKGQHLYALDWEKAGGLANGLYYLVVEDIQGGQVTRQVMKLLILR